MPEGDVPSCPAEVSSDVRTLWDYYVRQLKAMRIITMADRDTLLAFCEAVDMHRKASAILAGATELIAIGLSGNATKHPAFQMQRDAAATMRVYAREFGFTPSARSEIRASKASGTGDAKSPERLLSA
jgi:P27 family predicted phage terminase small subunit